jgi:hypothetical protein
MSTNPSGLNTVPDKLKAASSQKSSRSSPQAGRDLKDLAVLSWAICLFTICLLFVAERRSGAERDFVYFYGTGRIANEHSPEQIYSFDIQRKTFQEVYKLGGDRIYGPSPYPPFVPLFFSLFARLPFERAYHIWQLCTLALFCGGVSFLANAAWPKQRLSQSLAFAGALSFPPFSVDTLAAGQLTAIGCFAFSLALVQEQKNRFFMSGLALSIALYKPTLLLLVIPMLLIRRQWRTLWGVTVGAVVLFALASAIMGVEVWTAYLRMLLSLGSLHRLLEFSRYVDVFAFSTLLARNHLWIKDLTLVSVLAGGGTLLILSWIRSTKTRLVWATTILWTLVLNVYVPIYDSSLVVSSVVWSAPCLIAAYRRSFIAIVLLVFGCSCISELVARTTGIQILTLALMLLGALQLWVALTGSDNTEVQLPEPGALDGCLSSAQVGPS